MANSRSKKLLSAVGMPMHYDGTSSPRRGLVPLVFVVLQVPTALSKNLGALLPLRFLAGFMGSPALATGGASLADMWALEYRAVTIGLWSVAAVCGPVLGPLVGGFAVEGKGWTWTIWILLWLGGFTLTFLIFLLSQPISFN